MKHETQRSIELLSELLKVEYNITDNSLYNKYGFINKQEDQIRIKILELIKTL